MLTLKLKERDNFKTMLKIEAKLYEQVGEGVLDTANAIVADIRSAWSGSSPSARGSAPAVVTGLLDSSVKVDEQGRDLLGRFTNPDNAQVRYIRVDTEDGEPGGYNYAEALEDPNYLDRPFLAPALERAAGYYAANLKRFVRL